MGSILVGEGLVGWAEDMRSILEIDGKRVIYVI